MIYPTKENLWNVDSVGSFKNIDPASDDEARYFAFRGIILIPLFATMSIIDLGQSMPQDAGFIVLAAGKQWLEENKNL